jgi:hypothetical protein
MKIENKMLCLTSSFLEPSQLFNKLIYDEVDNQNPTICHSPKFKTTSNRFSPPIKRNVPHSQRRLPIDRDLFEKVLLLQLIRFQ